MSSITDLAQLLRNDKRSEDDLLKEVLRAELEIEKQLRKRDLILEFLVTIGEKTIKIKEQGDFTMSNQLQDNQEVVLTATVLDSEGKPATLVATPVWTGSDPTVATLTANGLTATVVPVSTGAFTVTFSVDGVTATFELTVTGGPAATATITMGTPTAIPAPTPASAAPAEPTEPTATSS